MLAAREILADQRQNMESRQAMLIAIRRQLAASAPLDVVRSQHQAHFTGTSHTDRVAAIEQPPTISLVEHFRVSLEAVSGHCVAVRDEVEAATAVLQIIGQRERIAVSNSPLVQRVMRSVEHHAELIEAATPPALFDCDAGITGAQWAIAETGTLALESEEERHRLISLVPPMHIAIIEAGRIRQTMGEVLRLISENGGDALSRTVTFITGPSRTSDIELTLAIGVHGPAELHVIVIVGENS